jgi:hypothetical protein
MATHCPRVVRDYSQAGARLEPERVARPAAIPLGFGRRARRRIGLDSATARSAAGYSSNWYRTRTYSLSTASASPAGFAAAINSAGLHPCGAPPADLDEGRLCIHDGVSIADRSGRGADFPLPLGGEIVRQAAPITRRGCLYNPRGAL